MSLKKVKTLFRAYQLGNHGASFSYFYNSYFTLCEARYNDVNGPRIKEEMLTCGVEHIDCLHITSWDSDHCNVEELKEILKQHKPKKIEIPGYTPHSETAKEAEQVILHYQSQNSVIRSVSVQRIDPPYIKGLDDAKDYGYTLIRCWPKQIHDCNHNNNSSVTLYRTGAFNVLSSGDVEDHMIGRKFLSRALKNELDILVLPHHGAETGFANQSFLKDTKPLLAVCNSNYDNQFDHPAYSVRELLHKLGIPLFTTKTGDVLIRSSGMHDGHFTVTNLTSDSKKISSQKTFISKKRAFLSMNTDTIRDAIKGRGYRFPKH